MSTQNQFPNQGSPLEQKAKRKTNLPLVVGIFLGIHAVVLGGILMSGCKREDPPVAKRAAEPPLPPITPPDTGSPVTPAPVPPIGGAATPGGAGTLAPLSPLPPAGTPVTPAPGAVAPAPPAPAPAPVPVPVPPVTPAPITPAPTPAPEPAPPAPAGEAKVHVVAKNDSFYTMSKKYGVGMKAIEAANPGVDSTRLKIGQKINIPAAAPKAASTTGGSKSAPAAAESGTYTVKSGDNLGKIAKSHGTTVAKLREANGLKTDQIKVGQKLKLPNGSSKKSPEPVPPATSTAPLPRTEPVPLTPPALPPLGEPAPKPPGQF
ncbi:MAG: hypothetical protein B9S33_06680 [Pedosphaera sp. Tous-C6FEB]|nr:MAG: hypothetical protein B9S33_06680 [Pedosphaera sp. Tous-C6FEB]